MALPHILLECQWPVSQWVVLAGPASRADCANPSSPLQAREEEEEEDRGTVDSAVGSGSVAESTSLNIEPCSETSDTTVSSLVCCILHHCPSIHAH